MTMRSFLIAVPLVGVMVALSGCSEAKLPVVASSATASVSRAELLHRQERLGPVARDIQDLVDPLEGPVAKRLPSGENRYGQVRIDSQRNVVELWWAGDLPPEVTAVLEQHPSIDVEVHRARYSNNELQAAGTLVVTKARDGLLGPGVTIDAVEHDVPGGRIVVHVVDPHGRWTTSELHRQLDSLTPVPLGIIDQQEPTLHGL